MLFPSWLRRSLFAGSPVGSRRLRHRAYCPMVETLEDRLAPAGDLFAPSIAINVSVNPTTISSPTESVTYTVLITNTGDFADPVTITTIVDDNGTPAMPGDDINLLPIAIAQNGGNPIVVNVFQVFIFSFARTLMFGPGETIYTNIVTVVGQDDEGEAASDSDSSTVRLDRSDLIAKTIAWSAGGDGVDFTYEVAGKALEKDTTVGLFWASGPTQDDIISQAFSKDADRTVGPHVVHAAAGEIAAAPEGAKYLLEVVDRDDRIEEKPSNNQVPLRLPKIEVIDPLFGSVFRITAEPRMPSITVGLNDVPAILVPSLWVDWHTEISSGPGDFNHQVATFAATPIDFTVTASDRYEPDFGSQIVGGKLTFTATFSVAGVQLKVSSADLKLRIVGTQPDPATIEAYVRSKHVPYGFPTGGGFTYHEVLLRIMRHESFGGLQFWPDGAPVFNTTDDGGAGLFQITDPAPTVANVWNWKANVDKGVDIFNGKLAKAITWIDNLAINQAAREVRQQFKLPGNTPVQVVPPPWSRDVMVLREAVQRYGRGGGPLFRARGQRVILPNGTTIIQVTWERDMTKLYHEEVLGALNP